MWLTRVAITRPLAMLMFIVGLVLLGGMAWSKMRVDRLPNINIGFVNVSVSYPGASPTDVEELIVRPVEATLAGLPGVAQINSTASEGRGNVSLQLVEGADVDKVALDVARAVERIRGRLPDDAGAPVVNRADPNSFPMMNVVLSGRMRQDQLYTFATEQIQPRLQSILGVADVSVSGGQQSEIQIQLDYTKLEAYGVSPQQVSNAITRENLNQPVGTIQDGIRTASIRTVGAFQKLEDLENLVVTGTPNGAVRLRDVATVTQGFRERTRYQRFNGQESVGLSITKQSDANTLEVADSIRVELDRIRESLPEGVELRISNDSSRFVRRSLEAVYFDLGLAVLLCGLVLLLFLHTLRNTLIVMLAIPTSLITTFLVMWAFGFSINTISLMALALTIGILVDDSIVVLENINRHLHMGEMPTEAAFHGRTEIGLAAMAITLTDVVVYLPVAFMQGNIGRLFKEYGLTIAAATLLSLFISFTLTPMLASRWLKAREEYGQGRGPWAAFTRAWERGFDRIAEGCGWLIGHALRVRPLVVLIGALALGGSLAMLQFNVIGSEYAPQEDDNQINVSLSFPPGTRLEVSNPAALQIEQQLMRIPEVEAVFASVGGGGFGGFGGGGANFSVQLKDKHERERSVFQILPEIRRMGANIPEATLRANAQGGLPGGGGGPGGGGVSLRIQGEDIGTLTTLANQIEDVLRTVPGVVDVNNQSEAGQTELHTVLDRRRMAELGVTAQQVAQTLRVAISGSVVSALRPEGGLQEDITLIAREADRTNLSRLLDLPIIGTGGAASGATAPVRLGQVATLEWKTGPRQIARSDRLRVVSLSTTIAGRTIGDVARDAREAVRTVQLPVGYRLSFTGQVQQLQVAQAALFQALAISVLLIYMLMVALYESWLHPLAIMFSLPMALVGAFVGLWATGNTFNLFSMIGMIMLMGMVAKNAILLVDFANQLRARGLERTEALIQAGRVRLRPIVMTTATLQFAMLPLALKFEAGAESRSPMAVVIMGGVLSSTLLTLVLVPVVYSYFDDMQNGLKRLRFPAWRRRPRVQAAEPVREPVRGPAREPALEPAPAFQPAEG
jgi:HAE1 family hydrophobic/amphiphilic exporter-1